MDGMMAARLGAVVFVAVAVTAAVVELRRKDERPEPTPPRPVQVNVESPLQSELLRCQGLGEAGPRDPACLRAWAENRRRFLTPGAATGSTERDPAPASSTPAPAAGGNE